jgi:hypothetical protein
MGDAVVFALFNLSKKFLERFQKRAYRQAYLAEHVRRGIAYQIRALRDQRNWKQGIFAKLLGKPQSVACRLEDPDYGKVTIQTLLEVANVFDVALQVRFVPYSTFVRNTRDVSSTSMQAPEFKDDLGFRVVHSANIKVFLPSSEEGSFETGWLDQTGSKNTISVLPRLMPGKGGVHVFH